MPDLTGDFATGKLPKIAPGAITVTIERFVEPERRAAFETWVDDMMQAVQAADGCLGATVLAPAKPAEPFHIVFRFVDVLHLRQWERSEPRQRLLAESDHLIVSERVTVTAGSERFFGALGEVQKHRTHVGAFLSDLAWIYPTALLFTVVLAPLLAKVDMVPRVLISTAVVGATSKWATGPVRRWWRRRRMLPQNAEIR